MKIDIKPKIKLASPLEKVILEMREIPALYAVYTSDGKEYSTQWDEKSLAEFCPNRTVSEMLKNWQDGFLSQIEQYKKAVETNTHPFWTSTVKTMVHYPQYAGHPELEYRWNNKYHEEPAEMTKAQNRFFQSEIKKFEAISGELTFVKITNLVNSKGEETNGQGYTLKEFTKEINEQMSAFGLPVSKHKKKYFYTLWTQKEVLQKGWFNSSKTAKEIVKRISDRFDDAWN